MRVFYQGHARAQTGVLTETLSLYTHLCAQACPCTHHLWVQHCSCLGTERTDYYVSEERLGFWKERAWDRRIEKQSQAPLLMSALCMWKSLSEVRDNKHWVWFSTKRSEWGSLASIRHYCLRFCHKARILIDEVFVCACVCVYVCVDVCSVSLRWEQSRLTRNNSNWYQAQPRQNSIRAWRKASDVFLCAIINGSVFTMC